MAVDQEYSNMDFTSLKSMGKEFDNCTFSNCDFSGAHLSNFQFSECGFNQCNLSMSLTSNTSFQECTFDRCKLIGIAWESCNSFLLSFEFNYCQLNLGSFYQLNLKTSRFLECELHEVDFSESNLEGIQLENCDLKGAIFNESNLRKTNFETASNYSINLEANKVKGAKFSSDGLAGLLEQYQLDISE